MIDVFIVLFSLITFGCYVVLQFLFLRIFPSAERIGFLFRLQILIAILLASSLGIMTWLHVIRLETFGIVFVLSELFFNMLALLYVWIIFSYLESSIPLKLLSIINAAEQGITSEEMKHKYSKKEAIQRRLDRFEKMGIITRKGSEYTKTKHMNSFYIRECVFTVMNRLFPGK